MMRRPVSIPDRWPPVPQAPGRTPYKARQGRYGVPAPRTQPPEAREAPQGRPPARGAEITVAGIGYTLSWVAGLAVPAPSPAFGASGTAIVAALRGHGPALAAQFTLTEGLPAAGIAIVSAALARAARRHGAPRAARFALVAGLAAAIISALQFILGLMLALTTAPHLAHMLYQGVDRTDGVKMLALAVLGAAGAATAALPRWLRWTGAALAVAITCSGLVYLLAVSPLAAAAGPALVLLLTFITGCGIMIAMTGSSASKDS
jgi:hypothetical protein